MFTVLPAESPVLISQILHPLFISSPCILVPLAKDVSRRGKKETVDREVEAIGETVLKQCQFYHLFNILGIFYLNLQQWCNVTIYYVFMFNHTETFSPPCFIKDSSSIIAPQARLLSPLSYKCLLRNETSFNMA